jgi:hypothetical protein
MLDVSKRTRVESLLTFKPSRTCSYGNTTKLLNRQAPTTHLKTAQQKYTTTSLVSRQEPCSMAPACRQNIGQLRCVTQSTSTIDLYTLRLRRPPLRATTIKSLTYLDSRCLVHESVSSGRAILLVNLTTTISLVYSLVTQPRTRTSTTSTSCGESLRQVTTRSLARHGTSSQLSPGGSTTLQDGP